MKEQKKEQEFIQVSKKALEKVLNYLARQPYAEVAQIIQQLTLEINESFKKSSEDQEN